MPTFSTIQIESFDWDDGNRDKCRRHGVSVDDIEALFRRPIAVLPDPAHSTQEERFKAIGTNTAGRHILIAFTMRVRGGQTFIRPIGARYMHKKEIRHYENQTSEAEKVSGFSD